MSPYYICSSRLLEKAITHWLNYSNLFPHFVNGTTILLVTQVQQVTFISNPPSSCPCTFKLLQSSLWPGMKPLPIPIPCYQTGLWATSIPSFLSWNLSCMWGFWISYVCGVPICTVIKFHYFLSLVCVMLIWLLDQVEELRKTEKSFFPMPKSREEGVPSPRA